MSDTPTTIQTENVAGDELSSLISYNQETGLLFWKARAESKFKTNKSFKTWNSRFAGKEALSAISRGYKHGTVMGVWIKAHRAAWALHTGSMPKGDIDHINGHCSDNRISNLRLVSHKENMKNQRIRSDNSSGMIGVYWNKTKGKWYSAITINGQKKHLGYFDDKAKATDARRDAESKYNFHQNHGRS